MNIVSKQDYWTTILNDLSQFGQITTEDPKFNEIADYVWRVLQNTLILTEDEKQIKHWEENGYQEFSSLDEAYERFGIEPEV